MPNDLPFIDPTAGTGRGRILMAPRPDDLAGKTLGLLDNTKEQGKLILETLGEALKQRYGLARVVLRSKEHYSKPAVPQIIEEMAAEVDIAIAAVGG